MRPDRPVLQPADIGACIGMENVQPTCDLRMRGRRPETCGPSRRSTTTMRARFPFLAEALSACPRRDPRARLLHPHQSASSRRQARSPKRPGNGRDLSVQTVVRHDETPVATRFGQSASRICSFTSSGSPLAARSKAAMLWLKSKVSVISGLRSTLPDAIRLTARSKLFA